MPTQVNRQNNPSPQLAFREITIFDDRDFGSGRYLLRTNPDVLAHPGPDADDGFMSSIINPPVFQLALTFNLGPRNISVKLGTAQQPKTTVVFRFPQVIQVAAAHDFDLQFSNWQITSLTMDGVQLSRQ
jgi:hypothetical protein